MEIGAAKMQMFMGDLPVKKLSELAGRAVANRVESGRLLAHQLQPHLSSRVAPHLQAPQFCEFVRFFGRFIDLERVFDQSTMQQLVAKLLTETLRDRGAHDHPWDSEYHVGNEVLKHLECIYGEFALDLAMKTDFPRLYLATMGVQHRFPMQSLPKTARSLFVLSLNQSNTLFSWCPPPNITHLAFPLGYRSNRQHPDITRDRSKLWNEMLFVEHDDDTDDYFLFLHRMIDAGLKERHADAIAFGLSAFDLKKDEHTLRVLCSVAVACSALKMEFLLSLSLVQHAFSLVKNPLQLQHISVALQQVYFHAGLLEQEGELFYSFCPPLKHSHLFADSILIHLRALTERIENHICYRRALFHYHLMCTTADCKQDDDLETTERWIDQLTCVIKAYEYALDKGTTAFFEGMAKLLRMASQMASEEMTVEPERSLLAACYKDLNRASFCLQTNNILRLEVDTVASISIILINPDQPDIAEERLNNAVKTLESYGSAVTRMKHSGLHIRNYFRLVLFCDIFALVTQQDLTDMCGSLKHHQLGFEGLLRGYRQSLVLRYIATCEGQKHFYAPNNPKFINEDLLSGTLHDKMAAWRFELNVGGGDDDDEEEEAEASSPSLMATVPVPTIAHRAIDYIDMDRARMKDAIMFSYESHVKHSGL